MLTSSWETAAISGLALVLHKMVGTIAKKGCLVHFLHATSGRTQRDES